jgi:uncharacterized small protein (DUF1192 family)
MPRTAQEVVMGLLNRPEPRLPDVADLADEPAMRDALAALAEHIDMLRQSVAVLAAEIDRLSAEDNRA